MFRPFRLNQPIGENFNMNLDDTLNTKKALAGLGHMKVPDHGLTEFPDQPMIDGVKSFQREQGLKQDGVMKTDGPTLKRLNETLASKRQNVQAPPPPAGAAPGQHQTRSKPDPQNTPAPRAAAPQPRFQPISLKRPVTPASNVDLGDAGPIKKALNDLGLLNTRDHGLDTFPDQPMFDAITAFQREHGLRQDGEMKPDGETVERLNQVVGNLDAGKVDDRFPPNDAEDTQVAAAQIAPLVWQALSAAGRTLGPAIIGKGAAEATKTLLDQRKERSKLGGEAPAQPNSSNRQMIDRPFPPLPGIEPPDEKLPDRTESLPQPVEVLDLSQPVPELDTPTIFITPVPKPGEFGSQILESKGGSDARKQIDELRDQFLEANPDCTHVGGGREQANGSEVKEFYTAGPGRAFKRPGRKHGDGRQGSARLDLSFRCGDGKTYIHYQTVDVDGDGNVSQREWDNTLRAWKNLNELRDEHGEIHHIYMVPKTWKLKSK